MKTSFTKRFLAWTIAFLMVFTYVPATAYAAEDISANHDVEAAAVEVDSESTDEVVTEEPAAEIEAEVPVNTAAEEAAVEETEAVVIADLSDIEVLDGKISINNSGNSGSVENDVVTIIAAGVTIGTPSANTITICNETDSEAVIKFDYKAENYSDFSESNSSGTFKKVLAKGGTAKMHITGNVKTGDAVLTLSNFSLEPVKESYDVTISYDDQLGSVTAGGAAVADGTTKAVSYTDGLALTASPAAGAEFLGWIDAKTSELYTAEESYTVKPTSDEYLEAVFADADSEPYFLVAGKYLIEGFEAAVGKTADVTNKTMVLMNDVTLKSGDYTVPAGVTLLIPFDDKNTLYKETPGATHDDYKTPVAYRTLKLADGANLIVEGALSLSAKHYAANGGGRGSGAPTGDVSFIDMEKGSTITVNKGAFLYAYGFIVGEGTVTAKNGATVYENFQIEDFRGGTATTDMAFDETLVVDGQETGINHGVLPLSQYYVQNIEVPLTLEAGATENTYTSVFMNGTTIFGAAVPFISKKDAMFNLESGNVVKSYDGSKDRLIVEANGDMTLSSITIRQVLAGEEMVIDSSDFELPINSNITVKMNSGDIKIDQDIALLPGAEIIIEKGATCSLQNGANVYVYDADQWGEYCGSSNAELLPVMYAYSRTAERKDKDLVDASIKVNGVLDASEGFLYTTTDADYNLGYGNIYSTEKGIVKMVTGFEEATYQYVQGDSEPYKAIYLLPANLKHGDGTYIQTLDETAGTYTYTNGVWLCDHKRTLDEETKAPTCTEPGEQHIICVMEHEFKVETPAKGHNKVTDPAVKGSCTVDAKTEGSHCSVCNEVLKAQVVTSAPGHTEVVDEAVEVTCLTDGKTEGAHCSVCGEITKAQEPVKALGYHVWEVAGKEPTCTEDGFGSSKCKNCEEEIIDDTIEKLGHDYAWTVTEKAGCETEGEKAGVCQRKGCGHETTAVIEATGHTFKNYVDNKDATCDKEGKATATCEVEGCDATDERKTEALGHIWKKDDNDEPLYEVDVKPTCTEKGSESVHCERCDATNAAREIEATGHTEETLKAVAPTCTDKGLTAGVKCSVCNEVLTAQEEVDSLGGHNWNTGTVTKLPTEKEDGVMTFRCQNESCTESRTEAIKPSKITNYEDFVEALAILEDWAFEFAIENNVEDPAELVIKYVRTGVDRYNSGSWEIMAGLENTDFAKYVAKQEAAVNEAAASDEERVNVTGLKNVSNFKLPNGDYTDFGHMFGTIDISYTNKNSINHHDVAGFFGDTTDLLSTADRYNVSGTIEEMVKTITDKYFLVDNVDWDDKFGNTDMIGDLDGYYVNRELLAKDYEKGLLTDIVKDYFTEDLTKEQRAKYYLENRLQCGSSKSAVRDAVYVAYTGNSVITTLEGTREFNATGDDLEKLRMAACYTVADYICRLAGDYVENVENPYFTVTSAKYDTLAPGVTQEIKTAELTDGRSLQYYIATADITRDDVNLYANYYSRPVKKDEEGNYIWQLATVLEQAQAAQDKFGTPELVDPDTNETYANPDYIENYNVVVSTNTDGFTMTGENAGTPGGLVVMDGEEVYPVDGGGFFGILKNGKAVIGTQEEYNTIYKDQVAEAIGGFGAKLIEDGKIVDGLSTNGFHSRTAVGITGSGKVVMMVLDGRQDSSVGGDMAHLAHIMLNAGCVEAINLDGGGSTTFVAKQPGEDSLEVINQPSDGYARSVGPTMMVVSTAKSSTVFDHAVLETPTNYMTVGSEMQVTASGVTSTGNPVDLPENVTWEVSNDKASISEDGKLTALKNGSVYVYLMQDGVPVGQKQIHVAVPDRITFTRSYVDVVYNSKVTLPIKAYKEGKAVTINPDDFEFTVGKAEDETASNVGTMSGLDFVAGSSDSGIRRIDITAAVKDMESVTATIEVRLWNQGENSFDFDQKTGGDRMFAWSRVVTNSTTQDNSTYYAVETNKDIETSYTFAIDMTQIPIPDRLAEIVWMLPGAEDPNACAWNFLCQLAQRISDITEVTATVKVDEDFEVDYSGIKIVNDYFELKDDGVVFDEKTNTLTMTLKWVRQYSPIDIEMANPLCLVTGIKITPKADADWGEAKSLNAINEGSVSYKIYMRANALVSFSNKPENQEKYGLFPFSYTYIDKNNIEQIEEGAGFGDTYKTFTDSFTLVNAVKNGWYVEDGGWRYYEEGEKYTGIHQITHNVGGEMKSLYYDFGEDGLIKGNVKDNIEGTTYTGLIENADHTYSYSRYGVLTGGWVDINGEWHYFAPDTKKSLEGKHKIEVTAQTQSSASGPQPVTITETVEYEFDKTGKVMNGGTWFVNDEGQTFFYYGPGFLCRQWGEKDGQKVYFAMGGYLLRGIVRIREHSEAPAMYHMFDKETGYWIQKCEGFVEYEGATFYYPSEEDRAAGKYPEDVQDWEAEGDVLKYGRVTGFQEIDGKYYLFTETYGGMLKGKRTVEHDIPDACTTLTFDKEHGYAVDKDGNPRTDLKHVEVTDKAVASTCAKMGLTEGSHCEECGEVIVAQQKTAVKKHTYGKSTWKAPTAKTTGGYYQKCNGCGQVKWTKKVTYAQYVKSNMPKTIIKVTATGSTKTETINVKWTTSTNAATYYKVERATSKNGKYKTVKAKATTKSYVDKSAKAGKTYYYRVTGFNKLGKVTYKTKVSNKDSAKLTKVTKSYVQKSTMKASTAYKSKAVVVKWTAPRIKAGGYEVYRATSLNGKYTKVATTKASTLSYTDKKVSVGKRYYYKVRAYKKISGKKVYTKYSPRVNRVVKK